MNLTFFAMTHSPKTLVRGGRAFFLPMPPHGRWGDRVSFPTAMLPWPLTTPAPSMITPTSPATTVSSIVLPRLVAWPALLMLLSVKDSAKFSSSQDLRVTFPTHLREQGTGEWGSSSPCILHYMSYEG